MFYITRSLWLVCVILSSCTLMTTKEIPPMTGTDFHMHIHTQENKDDDVQFNAERALFAADSIGLYRALLLPNGYSKNADEEYTKNENDFVFQQAEKKRSRLVGACAVNPIKPWSLKEIKRCHDMGLRIFKLHFMASGLDLKNPTDYQVAKSFLSEVEKLGFTVLVHANYPAAKRGNEIEKLKELIELFPKIRWIIGHLFGKEFKILEKLKHPNYYVEISVVPIWMRTPEQRKELRETMRSVGMRRFVFGSDWPVFHPAETLKYLKLLELDESEINAILYKNAEAFDDLFKSYTDQYPSM
jgi:predicted TIM-barrel fold metal-dependent hydrolase